jgi:hypothetical protein
VVLGALRSSMPPPPPGSTVIARGFDLFAAPGVPVFAATWDLNGAVKLLWNDKTLQGWPAPPGALRCTAAGTTLEGIGAIRAPAPYGRAYIVDVRRPGAATRVDSRRTCATLARSG